MNSSLKTLAQIYCLKSVDRVSTQVIHRLSSVFGSLNSIFESNLNDLILLGKLPVNTAKNIISSIDNLDKFLEESEQEIELLSKHNCFPILFWEDNYPNLLKRIYSPPLVLYASSTFKDIHERSIAMIGTRKPTDYGKHQAMYFSRHLSKQGLTIVSGLARGIDSISHKGALKENGQTVAVLGCGLDIVYPPENKKLFEQIKSEGILLTEYKLGTKPDAFNFPNRNRIISGLSLGSLVVESRASGGSLQTARFALEQNREVFAIPGNIGIKDYEGTNTLIKKGEAKLIQSPEDVLVELQLSSEEQAVRLPNKPEVDLSFFEQKIIETLTNEKKHIDLISKDSELSISECLVHLLTLEFKGLIKQHPGKYFSTIYS